MLVFSLNPLTVKGIEKKYFLPQRSQRVGDYTITQVEVEEKPEKNYFNREGAAHPTYKDARGHEGDGKLGS